MPRHRQIVCHVCTEPKTEEELVAPRIPGDTKRTCYECFRGRLGRYFALKAEEKRLLEKGVHPKMVERIMREEIKRNGLDPTP